MKRGFARRHSLIPGACPSGSFFSGAQLGTVHRLAGNLLDVTDQGVEFAELPAPASARPSGSTRGGPPFMNRASRDSRRCADPPLGGGVCDKDPSTTQRPALSDIRSTGGSVSANVGGGLRIKEGINTWDPSMDQVGSPADPGPCDPWPVRPGPCRRRLRSYRSFATGGAISARVLRKATGAVRPRVVRCMGRPTAATRGSAHGLNNGGRRIAGHHCSATRHRGKG